MTDADLETRLATYEGARLTLTRLLWREEELESALVAAVEHSETSANDVVRCFPCNACSAEAGARCTQTIIIRKAGQVDGHPVPGGEIERCHAIRWAAARRRLRGITEL